jgi:predicted Zn-dependent protease
MLAVAMVFGDAGQMEQFLMYNAAGLASMSFSREQELVADSDGLSLMYKSYIDASGLPRFLKKLSAEEVNLGGVFTMLSTHPASDERVNRLNRTLASWPPQQVTPITPNWATIKTRCAPAQLTDPDGP